MPFMIPPAPIVGTLQYYWIDKNAVVRDLNRDTSPSRFVVAGSVGLGDAEFDITDEKFPRNPGSFIRQINTHPRTLHVPIYIRGTSLGNLSDIVDDTLDWFDTGDEISKHPGYFRVVRPDGTTRQIAAYKNSAGLVGDMKEGGVTWTRYVVDLYCPDPYPTDPDDTVIVKATGYNNFGVLNSGRLETYPIWKLTGPFTSFLIDNATTHWTITGTITIAAGHYLILDHRPSELRTGYSVYDDTGTNRQANVTPGSVFGLLEPGTSICGVSFGGSSGATQVQLTYLQRYRALLR